MDIMRWIMILIVLIVGCTVNTNIKPSTTTNIISTTSMTLPIIQKHVSGELIKYGDYAYITKKELSNSSYTEIDGKKVYKDCYRLYGAKKANNWKLFFIDTAEETYAGLQDFTCEWKVRNLLRCKKTSYPESSGPLVQYEILYDFDSDLLFKTKIE